MPLSSDRRKPALSALLRNLALGLDAARSLVEQDGFYATDAGYTWAEELSMAASHLAASAVEAIDRQLEERAQ